MPVIAIVNRKGGSGKSTLATHLAAYCANAGMSVMLGDVDHQQSTQTWLRLRAANSSPSRPRIVGWAVEPSRGMRAPVGTTHVILDTPGGLTGLDLARVVMFADVIVMPVCNSVFDRESAAQCHAELMKLPRVASGRCKLAAVGMRLDARTRGAVVLREWAASLKLPFIGVLRDTQAYVRCIEAGLTLFDQPESQVQTDLLQWGPILRWLEPVLRPGAKSAEPARSVLPVRPPSPAALESGSVAIAPQASASVPASTAAGAGPLPCAAVEVPVVRVVAVDLPRIPIEEPPILTAVVPPPSPLRHWTPDLPARSVLAKPTLGFRLRGLLDLGPILKRVQRSA